MTPARARTADTPAKRLLKRALIVTASLGALAFAITGGEFGTADVLSQRARRDQLRAEVVALRAQVDSLAAEVKSVTTDDARLERMARERFGMVRGDKEVLYWITRGNDRSGNRSADSGTVRPRG